METEDLPTIEKFEKMSQNFQEIMDIYKHYIYTRKIPQSEFKAIFDAQEIILSYFRPFEIKFEEREKRKALERDNTPDPWLKNRQMFEEKYGWMERPRRNPKLKE